MHVNGSLSGLLCGSLLGKGSLGCGLMGGSLLGGDFGLVDRGFVGWICMSVGMFQSVCRQRKKLNALFGM